MKTAFFPPLSLLRMFLVRKKGRRELCVWKRHAPLLRKAGWWGRKGAKYFVKKYGFLLFYSRNSSNFHKNFRSNGIFLSQEEKGQKIIIPLNT